MTISVDEYASASNASSAYEEAVRKSRIVPGFKPISVPNLGPHAFIGTVTLGAETHVGLGALDGMFVVGTTLVGYEPKPDNIAKLVFLTQKEEASAKAVLGPHESIDMYNAASLGPKLPPLLKRVRTTAPH